MISFAQAHPELAPEWAEPEGGHLPDKVSYGSNKKVRWRGKCGHEWTATVKNRGNGSGCPFCSGNRVLKGFNDLATAFPELAAEWSRKNSPLSPADVAVKANRKVWWRCRSCGQEWQARIADRTDGHGCPVCVGEKLAEGINDLAAQHPELAAEWGSANDPLTPFMVSSKSRRNVWWRCRACGYEWKAIIDSRVKGRKCPACDGRTVKPGYNDLKTLHPDLSLEWDVSRNGGMLPESVRASSMRAAFWKDRFGHRFRAKVSDRINGSGCPVCRAREKRALKANALKYYAGKAGAEIRFGSEDEIGIELEAYFPQQRASVEYSDLGQDKGRRRRYENAKNWLCLKSGIKLFRILEPGVEEFDNCICITLSDDSHEALSQALQAVFDMAGMDADVDIMRDMQEISG